MRRKIIYFINPVSGIKNKEALMKLLEERTRQQEIPFEVLYTNPAGNYYFLKEKIDSENITDIVICGGDGTVNQISGALIDVDVNIGIIPAGSGNGLAFAAKIPKQVDKAMDVIFNGKASYIDAFYINSTYSCMLSGLGFDAEVAHKFALQSKRGLSTYTKESIKQFFYAEPYKFDITSMGTTFSTDAYFICIANGNQFGNQVTIAPQASLNDGFIDVVVVQNMNKLSMIWALLKQIRSGQVKPHKEIYFQQKGILYFQTDKLVINNLSMAPLHVDGEPATTARKITVEVIPGAFRLIQPIRK
jgi:diacylglycerol kinase (ATP)